MRFSKKIFNMPFNFRGYDGYIQCYTGDGEREVIEKLTESINDENNSFEFNKNTLRVKL